MTSEKTPCRSQWSPHPRRAIVKMIIVLALAVGALAALIFSIDDQVLDQLKHSLSIGTIIALVLLINIVSFVAFILLYAAYQWVRCDLKPGAREDELPG